MKEPTLILPAYRRNVYQDPIAQYQYVCLGHKISILRQRLGISQRQFAEFVGISRSYLSKLEQGAGIAGASVEVMLKIAQCLNISISQLMKLRVTDYKICNDHLCEHYEKVEFFRLCKLRFIERSKLF